LFALDDRQLARVDAVVGSVTEDLFFNDGACNCFEIRVCLDVGGDVSIGGDLTVDGAINGGGAMCVAQFAMKELNVPALNSSPQNNLVIAGLLTAMLLRFQVVGPGTVSLTGVDKPTPAIGGCSREWVFYNRSSSTRTLQIENENAGSTNSNRFRNRGGVARLLLPGESQSYFYDEGDSRWVELA
jgi:hypothetical protein